MFDLRSNEHCLSSSKNRTKETFRIFFKKTTYNPPPPLFRITTTFQLLKFCSPFIFLILFQFFQFLESELHTCLSKSK